MTASFPSGPARSAIFRPPNQPDDDNQSIAERGASTNPSVDHRLSGLSRRHSRGSDDDLEAPASPPLPHSLSAKTAKHPYSDWNLQAVTANHRDRLHRFFVHKGGFGSPASAEQFWHEHVLTLAKKFCPAEPTIRVLRSIYFEEFSEDAKAYEQKSTRPSADIAQQMHKVLRNPDSSPLLFPSGREIPSNFIDIGCGQGQKTSALAKTWSLVPKNAIGLDIAPISNESRPKNIIFKEMSPNTLPKTIQANSQELAIISMVLHHTNDPETLLQSAHSALKPGGYLFVREHNASPDKNLVDFLNTVHIMIDNVFKGKKACMPNFKNYKSLDEWQRIFEDQGFEPIKIDYTPFSTDPKTGDPRNTGENFTCVLKKKGNGLRQRQR